MLEEYRVCLICKAQSKLEQCMREPYIVAEFTQFCNDFSVDLELKSKDGKIIIEELGLNFISLNLKIRSHSRDCARAWKAAGSLTWNKLRPSQPQGILAVSFFVH